MNVLGIPIRYDAKLGLICRSGGFLRWKWITIGPDFPRFPPREQQAMLLHEAGHVKLWHVEKRVLNLWRIFWPPALLRYCRAQEFQADAFAADLGYGADLARAFSRIVVPENHFRPYHPPLNERIARLAKNVNLTASYP